MKGRIRLLVGFLMVFGGAGILDNGDPELGWGFFVLVTVGVALIASGLQHIRKGFDNLL